MRYTDLVEGGATATEKQAYFLDGGMTAITIRIPKNLRDAGKEATALKDISFSAYVRMCMLENLVVPSNWFRRISACLHILSSLCCNYSAT